MREVWEDMFLHNEKVKKKLDYDKWRYVAVLIVNIVH